MFIVIVKLVPDFDSLNFSLMISPMCNFYPSKFRQLDNNRSLIGRIARHQHQYDLICSIYPNNNKYLGVYSELLNNSPTSNFPSPVQSIPSTTPTRALL